jgi:hypothetical protein
MDRNAKIDDLKAKPKYRSELAEEYFISLRTLNRWIKRANLDIPHGLIDPYHLRIIYKEFGIPGDKKMAE